MLATGEGDWPQTPVDAFVAKMTSGGFSCGDVQDLGWGRLTALTLPGGSELGVYEPRHASPLIPGAQGA